MLKPLVLLAALALPYPALAQDALVREGQVLVEGYCADCHAIGLAGDSPHPEAPPFRTLHERYAVDWLSEALVEGLVTGHPDMPEFEFDPIQAASIVAYLQWLEVAGPDNSSAKPPAAP